jgi:hypothetical protein
MVMVKRSLDAAKAIMAGNSVNWIISVSMAPRRSWFGDQYPLPV